MGVPYETVLNVKPSTYQMAKNYHVTFLRLGTLPSSIERIVKRIDDLESNVHALLFHKKKNEETVSQMELISNSAETSEVTV